MGEWSQNYLDDLIVMRASCLFSVLWSMELIRRISVCLQSEQFVSCVLYAPSTEYPVCIAFFNIYAFFSDKPPITVLQVTYGSYFYQMFLLLLLLLLQSPPPSYSFPSISSSPSSFSIFLFIFVHNLPHPQSSSSYVFFALRPHSSHLHSSSSLVILLILILPCPQSSLS